MQRMLRCLAVFGVVLGLAATGLNGAKAAELEKLRLAYASNVPGPDSVFLFAGKQLGFFKDEGIDLEIQIAGGTTAAAAFVASGTSDVALGGLEAMPGYLERGVAMKAIYVYAYRPIFSLAFLKGGKVSSIEGLKGTRVGVLTLSSGSVPVLQYILKEAGMQMSDV